MSTKKDSAERLRVIRAQLIRIAADAVADSDDALAQRAIWASDALRENAPALMFSFAGPGKIHLEADTRDDEDAVRQPVEAP